MATLIWHIIRYEFIKSYRENTLSLVIILVGVLTFYAVYNGHHWLEFQRSVIEDIQKANQVQKAQNLQDLQLFEATRRSAGLDAPANPTTMYAGKRIYAVKKPSSWSVLCVGQSDALGYYQIFTGINDKELLFENEIVSPVNLSLGQFDYTFFVLYLLPLLVIALCFDLFSKEQELQTLRVVLTQHLSLMTFLLAKSLYRFLFLWSAVALFLLVALFCCEPSLLRQPITVGVCLLLLGGYISFWVILSLLFNLLRQGSVFNGVVLVVVWIALLFLTPTLLYHSAIRRHPIPSEHAVVMDLRRAEESIKKDDALKRLYTVHPAWKPENVLSADSVITIPWYAGFIAWQMEYGIKVDHLKNDRENKLLAQETHINRFAIALPPLYLRKHFMELSGNSTADFISFKKACRTFHTAWQWQMADKIFRRQKLTKSDIEQIPILQRE